MVIVETIAIFALFLFSIICHECSHGWVAYRCGDPTAKQAGRLTFNPLKHIDPVGTILVPLILKLLPVHFVFGWAKPVPINFARLRNPRRDMMLVAFAGPAVNIILAVLLSALLPLAGAPFLRVFVSFGILINLLLALFNLIPIPPLDGSRIVMGILPRNLALLYARLERFGFIIVILLLNFGFLNYLAPFIEFMANFLGVDPSLL